MKISYFRDTDTLYIGLSEKLAVETQDLDDNTLTRMKREKLHAKDKLIRMYDRRQN